MSRDMVEVWCFLPLFDDTFLSNAALLRLPLRDTSKRRSIEDILLVVVVVVAVYVVIKDDTLDRNNVYTSRE
jgi:hypothetical protein